MKKLSKTVKATFLMGILFISMFAFIAPSNTVEAKNGLGFINLGSRIDVNWTQDSSVIVPKGAPQTYSITVTYDVSAGGYANWLSNLAKTMYYGTALSVDLEIVNKPDWAQINLAFYNLNFVIGKDLPDDKKVMMTITVNEDAPAFELGSITIEARVDTISKLLFPDLEGYDQTFSLHFSPTYLPLVDAQPVTNRKTIGPMDTAVFPIELENQGNERTTVFLSPKNVPSDWTAIITDSKTLEVNEKATVPLTIQAPRGFGYHYDTETIQVSVVPARATDPNTRGEGRIVSVQVESRGVSFIGIEYVIIPIIVLLAVVFFIFYYYKYGRKKMK